MDNSSCIITHVFVEGIKCTIKSASSWPFGLYILSTFWLYREPLKMDNSTIVDIIKAMFAYSCSPEQEKSSKLLNDCPCRGESRV